MAGHTRFKLRKRPGRNGTKTYYGLGLPAWIGEQIRSDQEFTVELTEEGILYRPTEGQPKDLPSWVKATAGG
jgi:hypothetical protein